MSDPTQAPRAGEVEAGRVGLADEDRTILRELDYYRRENIYMLRQDEPAWVRPMDVGGSDASDHSRRLARLCRVGLVERWDRSMGLSRPSYLYRITDAGSAALTPAGER